MKNFKWCPIVILVCCLVFSALVSHAAVVRISWNNNSDSDLEGYTVYYGPSSRNYTNMESAGLSTSIDIDTSKLTMSGTYYFAVTAKDTAGNESVFSQEVSITIPESVVPSSDNPNGSPIEISNTDSTAAGYVAGVLTPADTDIDGIPDAMESQLGLDPNNPLDALQDSDLDGVVNLAEYMAGTDPLNPLSRPSTDDILKDIIGEIGEVIDLTTINPAGDYLFKPMLASFPHIAGSTMIITKPGVYLYNVYDSTGILVYCLRISIATRLFTSGSFEPGSPLNLEELTLGISISLRADAALRQVPIGIANVQGDASSSLQYSDANSLEFELLPSGLTLAAPAQISIEFNGENPIVQRYNESDNAWHTVTGVTFEDGLVTFSAQKLGRFKVYSETSGQSDAPSTASSGGSGGGCFINTAGI